MFQLVAALNLKDLPDDIRDFKPSRIEYVEKLLYLQVSRPEFNHCLYGGVTRKDTICAKTKNPCQRNMIRMKNLLDLTSTVSALMTQVIPILPAGALHNLQAEQERNRKALQDREHFITVHME